jgi:hypothetical protein
MTADMLVSVVIVTFNNEHEIVHCIDSLFAELGSVPWELIVIDNCSQDGTVENVRSQFSRVNDKNARVEFICNEKNIGFTRALNQGLTKTRGQFILTLNPDTRLQPGSVKTLRAAVTPTCGVAAPQLLNADGSVQSSCRRFPRHRDVVFEILGLNRIFKSSAIFNGWKMGDFDHRHRRSVDQPQGACLFFTREVFDAVGLWDERFPMFFSDVDWCRRVKNAGFEIVFEPDAKVVHHKGVSIFQKRAAMIWSSHLSFYAYFIKHYSAPKFFVINRLIGFALFVTGMVRAAVAWLRKR